MKTLKSVLLVTFLVTGICAYAQNKVLNIHKNGAPVETIFLSEVDSIKFGVISAGNGFSDAEIGKKKNFVELGYPGAVGVVVEDSKLYGDLLMYHAYCGDYIVLLSRVYIAADPASPHCIKVVDKTTLNAGPALNLGSISISDIKMITSDYKGRCVAAIVKNDETEFFYWKNPTDAPKSIGKIGVKMAPFDDPSNNFQVAGDITGNAWITALAPRGTKGEHYRIKVTNGQLASNYSVFETGYPSNQFNQFQMISPLDDSDKPNFVVGTTGEKWAAERPVFSTRMYIVSNAGETLEEIPHYWNNTLVDAWWANTGFALARPGGRSPVVSALPINGKTYITVTTGTSWWYAAAVLNSDLQSLANEKLNLLDDTAASRGWSYGEWVDWYYNEDLKEAYLAIWFGRIGLYTFKLTCK